MSEEKKQQHFVLIHGACHGAWCWYKVKPLLAAAGHRVTALDLAASGIDKTRSITEISTCEQYSEPLMQLLASLPRDEKVVLVGHSFGGLSLAMAMDKFPDKISVSVFVTAFMPDTKHSPSFVLDKFSQEMPPEAWLGSELKPYGSDNSGVSLSFSTEFMKHALYQLSPIEIAAIVFLTGFMPDTINSPAYVYEKFLRSISREEWLDTMCGKYGKPDCPLEFALLGPKYMAKKMYQLSPVQDLVLAKMLVRVNPLVTDNLAGTKSFSEEGYGCITRIYIVCGEDLSVPEDYQRWMIRNFPPKEVMEIKDADHMAMFSKPKELCALLLEIACKYA